MPRSSSIVSSSEPNSLSKGSVVDNLVDTLREAIEEGKIGPGFRLVQDELCRTFSVGRGSLREALQRLESQGWIENVHNRGAVVRTLTRDEIMESVVIREVLEMAAAGLAAERYKDDPEAAELGSMVEQMDRAAKSDDRPTFLKHNSDFHDAIIRLSGNQRLIDQNDLKLTRLIQLQMKDADVENWLLLANEEHRAILAAIRTGDRTGAERAMRHHLGRVNAILRDLPPEAFVPLPSLAKR